MVIKDLYQWCRHVAHVGPQATRFGFAAAWHQHRYRGIVGVQRPSGRSARTPRPAATAAGSTRPPSPTAPNGSASRPGVRRYCLICPETRFQLKFADPF